MKTIAVAGKGGTGKTTLSALLVAALANLGEKPILAIDADPNSNLGEVLGLPRAKSLVQITDDFSGETGALPPGIDKARYLEFRVREALSEGKGVDLLLMGRTEGPGCYCYANHLLREHIGRLSGGYRFVVIDNEAGMEHVSRRTAGDLDILFLAALADRISLKSAAGINEMIGSMKIKVGRTCLVLNEFGGDRLPPDHPLFMKPLFRLPRDEAILEAAEQGRGILGIGSESTAFRRVRKALREIIAGKVGE